jgi:hypothetical protein
MGAYLTVSGRAAVSGMISMPRRGVWLANIQLEDGEDLDGDVVLSVFDGALELAGTVVRTGVFNDSARIRVVAGGGGWGKDVKARSYRNPIVRTLLEDLAGEAGEVLDAAGSDKDLLNKRLPSWCRMRGEAGEALAALLDALAPAGSVTARIGWRMMKDGRLWVGRERWPELADDSLELLEQDPAAGRATFGLEAPLILPGVVWKQRRVSLVEYVVEQSGLRAHVYFEEAP